MSFHWNGELVSREIRRRAAMGLKAAIIHLTNREKEVLSTPAPRVRLYDSKGAAYYRAGWLVNKKGNVVAQKGVSGQRAAGKLSRVTSWQMKNGQLQPKTVVFLPSPATPGAPPRKLSGRLRASITWEVDEAGMVARCGTNVVYARAHEGGNHPFAMVTLRKFQAELATLLGTIDYDAKTIFPT